MKTLTRTRWAARLILALGLIASGAANILHAQPNATSRIISAWPPVALFLAVELISRVPIPRQQRFLMVYARTLAAIVIAGIAAWVSYWHMVAVTAVYGETGSSAYLLPLTVDGLVVVASISLVELNARIREKTTDPKPQVSQSGERVYLPPSDVVAAQPQLPNGQRDTSGLIGTVTR